jgi:hypothetical protein
MHEAQNANSATASKQMFRLTSLLASATASPCGSSEVASADTPSWRSARSRCRSLRWTVVLAVHGGRDVGLLALLAVSNLTTLQPARRAPRRDGSKTVRRTSRPRGAHGRCTPGPHISLHPAPPVGVSAQKVEVFKKGSRADFLHYTASITTVDHGSTRITPRR